MKKVEEYIADDGTVFDNYDDCVKYEEKVRRASLITNITLSNKKVINIDDIKEFFAIARKNCKTCPFAIECDKTYSATRAHSTSALTICSALSGPEISVW